MTQAARKNGDRPIRETREEDRPRERLEALGAAALTDAELMAILFRTGTRSLSAVALAQTVLDRFPSTQRLAQASLTELRAVPGVGKVKAIELKAALELGKRAYTNKRTRSVRITDGGDVAEMLMPELRICETERLICVQVNIKNEVLKWDYVSQGGLDATSALPRDVFRPVLRDGASGAIIAHNHPSGCPEPSQADIALTLRLAEAAKLLGIRFLDHVVIGDGNYVSMKNRGLF